MHTSSDGRGRGIQRTAWGLAAVLCAVVSAACEPAWQQHRNVTPQAYVEQKHPARMRLTVGDTARFVIHAPWATTDSVGGTVTHQEKGTLAVARAELLDLETHGDVVVVMLSDGRRYELKKPRMTADSLVGSWKSEVANPFGLALADLTRWETYGPSTQKTVAMFLIGGIAAAVAIGVIAAACPPSSWTC